MLLFEFFNVHLFQFLSIFVLPSLNIMILRFHSLLLLIRWSWLMIKIVILFWNLLKIIDLICSIWDHGLNRLNVLKIQLLEIVFCNLLPIRSYFVMSWLLWIKASFIWNLELPVTVLSFENLCWHDNVFLSFLFDRNYFWVHISWKHEWVDRLSIFLFKLLHSIRVSKCI